MNINSITHPALISLQADFTDRQEVILYLIEQLEQQGRIEDKQAFLEAVNCREQQATTALGEGLAIPHGKSNTVKQASFAAVTLKKPILWKSNLQEEGENVNLIFLLAIPESEAGTTHIELLTKLTTALVDDETRHAILNTHSEQEFISLLQNKIEQEKQVLNNRTPKKTIICVTACPAGIAHTYMAAEYLYKAGQKLGINVYVEKQGANGIEDEITNQQLQIADACIFATEVPVKNIERFQSIPCIETSVAEPLRNAEGLLNDALEIAKAEASSKKERKVIMSKPKKLPLKTELKQALLGGISFAVPLIVAGGTVLAVAVLLAQIFNLQELYGTENSWLWMYRRLGGGLLGTLMVPVIAAYTAFSLADKPALAPGFAAGLAANMIGAGFLGGIAGGLLAGYLMRWVKNHIRLGSNFNGFLIFYLYPVIGTLVAGSLMLFVVGKPVALINSGLTSWLNGLSGSNAILLGAVIGAMCSFDLGGPVNKASYAFCLGAMANGVYAPYAAFASVKMVSAFTVTAATMIVPKLFKDFEIETGKSTWLLGLAGITEGAIPMAIEDPIRVLTSFITGSAITGAILSFTGIGLSTPGAGIFSLFLLHDNGLGGFMAAGIWLGAALLGTFISVSMLISWRAYSAKRVLA